MERRQWSRCVLRCDICSVEVQVLEDLFDQVRLRQVEFPVRGTADLDAQEVADGPLHGELQSALLEFRDDIVHITERWANKE